MLAAVAAVLVVVIIADRFVPAGGGHGVSDDLSIAVLPFADMSAERDQEYFADGISEELLNVFARVPQLEVAGRTSSFAFKGQNRDIREIGEILNVAHVLEGSVRKSGNRVRVTAQLIRADNGFHIWSETYDRNVTDIFEVQDEIANAIVIALRPQLLGGRTALKAARTDISAYELYLQAQQLAAARDYDAYKEAVILLDAALAIDPGYVPALAWRGYYELMTSDGDGGYGTTPIEVALPRAEVWINSAIAREPNSPDALFAKAGLLSMSPGAATRAASEDYYLRAIRAKPNFTAARNDYAYLLLQQGRNEEGIRQLETALEHDPALGDVNSNLVGYYSARGDHDRVSGLLARWEAISPDNWTMKLVKAAFEYDLGRYSSAYRIEQALLAERADDFRARRSRMGTLFSLGEFDQPTGSDGEDYAVYGLVGQGRRQEALDAARRLIAQRPDAVAYQGVYVSTHHRTADWQGNVDFFDTHWGSLEAYRNRVPQQVYQLLGAALKWASHPEAAKFISTYRDFVETRLAEGFKGPNMERHQAYLAALEDRPEDAMKHLVRAFDAGLRQPTVFIDPVFTPLRQKPEYQALLKKVEADINAQRAEIGLPPTGLPHIYELASPP